MGEEADWQATIERLKWLLVFALGEPEAEYAGSPDAFDGITAPAALRELHAFAANWPCEGNMRTWPLFGGYWPQNQLLTPDMWRTEDGFTIFASENQGVCHWAFRAEEAADPNPTVYCDIEGWEDSNEEPLAEFLLAWCMYELNCRFWMYGPARVLRLVETMDPILSAESPMFDQLDLYENKVLVWTNRRRKVVALVGDGDPVDAVGDATEPYRQVTLSFKYGRTRWRIVLDELGNGDVSAAYPSFDATDLVPAEFFDELYDAETTDESAEDRRAYASIAEPQAERTRTWSHTIRRNGYICDEVTARLFGYLGQNAELVPHIRRKSPFTAAPPTSSPASPKQTTSAKAPATIEVVDSGVQLDLGADGDTQRVRVAADAQVTLTGSLRQLELEALQGAIVDASDLEVEELAVLLEGCTVEATNAKVVSGYVAYGSTISVASTADIDRLKTVNGGRIEQRD